jgi:hypothetical protein
MLDSPVNIRSQPAVSAEIVGRLGLHDEIEILEKTNTIQQIEGIDQFWYKIRFSNIIGYIWGGYVAVGKYIFDIDNNGIIDYVYYRYRNHGWTIETTDDLIIYINNNKIPVNTSSWNIYYNVCYAFEISGIIYIKLGQSYYPADDIVFVDVYRVTNGSILFYKKSTQTYNTFRESSW